MWRKGEGMSPKVKSIIPVLAISLVFLAVAAHSQQEKFKLKPGAAGKLCLNCHPGFGEKLKKAHVHTPVKTGDCSGCHNPHASGHGKLLLAGPGKVCATCHSSILPAGAKSAHNMVAAGECVKCHDPHASNNKYNLLSAGNELCFGCHKGMKETLSGLKFKHKPVEAACLNCHNPHASLSASLLKEEAPGLCVGCHKTESPVFAQIHLNYPVAKSDCTSCHNPHGSNNTGIFYDSVHQPVTKKMCNNCHEESTSASPLNLKRAGSEICKGCHFEMMNGMFAKNRIHWPVLGKDGCLTCHRPHASSQGKLLASPTLKLCGTCHQDTIKRQAASQTKHPPVQEGNCGACHSPHSSDNNMLLLQPSMIDLCATCHEWQKHASHPLGEKVVDPRNANARLQCLSCHRTHGTEYKSMIPFPRVTDLCVQCHTEYKR